jgi:Dyp-type peroxidase family
LIAGDKLKTQVNTPELDLRDIQGDVLIGLQKQAELFLFFKFIDTAGFKTLLRQYVTGEVTSAQRARERERLIYDRQRMNEPQTEAWLGLNLGFTRHGMAQLLGSGRPSMEPAFERGADGAETIASLHDPLPERWLGEFRSDRIDGVLLIAGPNEYSVTSRGNSLRQRLGSAIKTVYSEMGTVRPGRDRRREHFGFLDGISQPGIRGLTRSSQPSAAPDQGMPGQDLIWPGEFVLGYPTQNPKDPRTPGPIMPLPAPWARNGSYMVFRRLMTDEARRRGISFELLASRMVGRWPSGAPMVLAPREDSARLAEDWRKNNDFGYAGDPLQHACPYAAHIRKVNPRDDDPEGKAAALTHRIIRAGIPFGPEVMPGETKTVQSRGLMFVCYQASIERQFEFIQAQFANNPGFVSGKKRPDSREPVTPGFDPIIGQALPGLTRFMDEPAPNYPYGNRRSALELPEQFVELTAAGYFFMPSLSALRTALTH